MKEPTKTEVREFWQKCGFAPHITARRTDPADICGGRDYDEEHWIYPDNSRHIHLPPIDLNTLFKFAVPEVIKAYENKGLNTAEAWRQLFAQWLNVMAEQVGDNPIQALFWAIKKVFDERDSAEGL